MLRKQNGFTIVEVLISLSVGLVLMAGVISIFVGMKTTSTETNSYGELQENGRFAMSLITDDLIRQNFWGDLTGPLDMAALTISPNPTGLSGDCVGSGTNNASFPIAVGHFRTLWGQTVVNASNMGCITNAKLASDIIQIKRAVASPFPDTVADPLVSADLEDIRYYIKSNTNTAAIFDGSDAIPDMENAQVWEYQHHIYYVREDTQSSTNKVPVLVQGRLQNAASAITLDMMVEGIEKLYFMYGVDSDDDGIVNAFIAADNMTTDFWDNADGARIIAVKIFVLARNILPDLQYENNNIYQLGDSFFDANGDNYRRLLFSSTITLYNAGGDSW